LFSRGKTSPCIVAFSPAIGKLGQIRCINSAEIDWWARHLGWPAIVTTSLSKCCRIAANAYAAAHMLVAQTAGHAFVAAFPVIEFPSPTEKVMSVAPS